MSRLVLDLRPGQALRLGDDIVLVVLPKAGQATRMLITAPDDVDIRKLAAEEAEKNQQDERRKSETCMLNSA